MNDYQATQEQTLDSVNSKLIAWRKNKKKTGQINIPDDLWLDIFKVAKIHTPSRVRHFFSLSSSQYNKKYAQLFGSDNNLNEDVELIDNINQVEINHPFCEVNIIPDLTPELNAKANEVRTSIKKIKNTKSEPLTYCDNDTVIVECIRSDGHRLKIHTVNKNAQQIVSNFFGGQL